MKRLLYLLMAALLVVLAAVSCKKDRTGDSDSGNNNDPEIVTPEEDDFFIVVTRDDETSYKLFWAKSNLSAGGLCAKPEDVGDFFAWGEVEPYYIAGYNPLVSPCEDWRSGKSDGYDWTSYKWCTGNFHQLTRYCPEAKTSDWDGEGETPDGKLEFKDYDYVDDAARHILKGTWRIPTQKEWDELRAQCEWEYTTINGVGGRRVKKEDGSSIFLPVTGYWSRKSRSQETVGNYWTSTVREDDPDYAMGSYFSASGYNPGCNARFYGQVIRPVCEE